MKNIVHLFFLCSFTFYACKAKTKQSPEPGKVYIEQENGKDIAKKYYDDGLKQTEGEVKDSTQRDGNWKYWYDSGVLWSECEYKAGIKHGKTKVYYKSGKLKYQGSYDNGKASGNWVFYNGDGSIEKEVSYD